MTYHWTQEDIEVMADANVEMRVRKEAKRGAPNAREAEEMAESLRGSKLAERWRDEELVSLHMQNIKRELWWATQRNMEALTKAARKVTRRRKGRR